MARGGIGVRHAQSQAIERSTRYRLVGVKPGSRVAECLDRYGRWEGGHRLGTILRNSVTAVTVQWDENEAPTFYPAADARYQVDRNRWRITPPRSLNIFEAIASTALTGEAKPASIALSPHQGRSTLTKEEAMPTPTLGEIDEMTLAQLRKLALTLFEPDDVKGLKKDQLKEAILDHLSKKGSIEEPEEEEDDELEVEDEEDDELPEEDDDELPEEDDEEDEEEEDEPPAKKKSAKAKSTPPEPNGDTLTAKQVATRIGTDAKTLRKFFRSPNSTVEPCGQGGRYEFAKTDLEKIRAEFEKWNTNKPKRAAKGTSKKVKAGRQAPAGVEVLEEDDELLELDDDEEPTPDVLDEIDDEIDEIDEELDVEDEEDDEEED